MQQLPFKAVVSDLDGTLLNANHVIGDFTIEILNKLEQKGVDIILATGRNHTDVSSILGKIGAEHAVMITSNGARVRDLKGNLIYSNSLPEEIVLELHKNTRIKNESVSYQNNTIFDRTFKRGLPHFMGGCHINTMHIFRCSQINRPCN